MWGEGDRSAKLKRKKNKRERERVKEVVGAVVAKLLSHSISSKNA